MPAGLHPSAQEWWRLVWASPMAALYLDMDVYPLAGLAGLLSARAAGEADHSAAIMALEDRFGLSPAGRRRLQWETTGSALTVAADAPPPDDRSLGVPT